MTNGDRIRQMSNEEMAEVINQPCGFCMQGDYCDAGCIEGIKAYLESEVE